MSEQTEETQVYTVTAPDGSKISVRGPVGATDEEIIKFAQSQYKPAAKPAGKPPKDEASERAWQKFTKDIEQADVPQSVREATIARAKELGQKFPVYTGTKVGEKTDRGVGDTLRQQLAELERQLVPVYGQEKSPRLAELAQLGATGAAAYTGYQASPRIAAGLERLAEMSQRPAFARPGTPPVVPPSAPAVPTAPLAAAGATPAAAPQSVLRVPTPERGYGTFQYGLSQGLGEIEASRALDMTKQQGGVHDLLTQRREAMNRIQQLFPTEAYAERPSGLMVPDQGAGRGPRESFAQQPALKPSPELPEGRPSTLTQMPPRQAIPPAPPPRVSPLTQVAEKLSTIGRTSANLFADLMRSRLMGAAGLGMAGYEGIEALKHLKAGRDEEAAMSGLSALGGGLMAIPTLPTAVVGGALTAAPYLYRAAKRATPQQSQQMLTSVNPMGDFAP